MLLVRFCHIRSFSLRNKLLFVIGVIVFYTSVFNIYVVYMNKSHARIRKQIYKYSTYSINDKLLEIQGNFSLNNLKEPISLFPWEPQGDLSDRIVNQMRFVPRGYNEADIKTIFFDDQVNKLNLSICPVNKCSFTNDENHIMEADLVLLRNLDMGSLIFHKSQIITVFALESPENLNLFSSEKIKKKYFNWTATYRYDSTIVTPYSKFIPYNLREPIPERYPLPKEDFSVNRNKKIAWFISNCETRNRRKKLGNALAKYFKIDIYGGCGSLQCSKSKGEQCFKVLRNYMFYLSFENSNCRHYITEKFFRNALNYSVIPIVMGAHPDDYKLVAPPHSYIHIEDFTSLDGLVKYLRYLMKNKTAYNEYFAWKEYGKLDTNTFFLCRLCTMLHYHDSRQQVDTSYMREWWNIEKACTIRTWTVKPFW